MLYTDTLNPGLRHTLTVDLESSDSGNLTKKDTTKSIAGKIVKNRNDSLSVKNRSTAESIAGPAINEALSVNVYMPSTLSRILLSGKRPAEVIMFGITAPNTKPERNTSSQIEYSLEK